MGTYYVWDKYAEQVPQPVEIDDAKLAAKRESGSQLKVQVQRPWSREGELEGVMVHPSNVYMTAREAWSHRLSRIRSEIETAESNLAKLQKELQRAEKGARGE